MAKNRREALKQGFALLGAAVGIGVARKSLAATPSAPSDARQSKQIVVHARGLRISSQAFGAGSCPLPESACWPGRKSSPTLQASKKWAIFSPPTTASTLQWVGVNDATRGLARGAIARWSNAFA